MVCFAEGAEKVPTNFPIFLQLCLGPRCCLGLAGKLAGVQLIMGTGQGARLRAPSTASAGRTAVSTLCGAAQWECAVWPGRLQDTAPLPSVAIFRGEEPQDSGAFVSSVSSCFSGICFPFFLFFTSGRSGKDKARLFGNAVAIEGVKFWFLVSGEQPSTCGLLGVRSESWHRRWARVRL